jgi:hypothetical protein
METNEHLQSSLQTISNRLRALQILKEIKSYIKPNNIKLPQQENIPIIDVVLTEAGKKFLREK